MAISIRATGAYVSGTAALTPVIPTAQLTGDMMLCFYGTKPYNDAPTIDQGWASLDYATDGTVAAGVDVGSMQTRVFYKIATTDTETNPIITNSTNNVSGAVIIVFQKGTGSWETLVGAGGGDATAGTDFSVTASSDVGHITGDMVVGGAAFRSEAAVPTTARAITITGCAMGTYNQSPATDLTTTSGGDMGMSVGYVMVSSGSSSAAPVFAITLAAGHTGSAYMVRLREAALTAVGDTVQKIWNIRQAVPDTSQYIYHIRALVSDTSQSIWNVRTAIGDTIQHIWHVRVAIGDTIQHVWHVRALATKTVQLVHHIRAVIGDTSQYIWNVLSSVTAVGDTFQLVWHIRGAVGKTRQALWNVRQAVSDTSQAIYNVMASVSAPLQAIYNVRGLTSKTRQTIWNIREAIGDTAQTIWNVQGLTAGKTVRLIWQIGLDRILKILTNVSVGQDLNLTTAGKKAAQLTYSIRKALTITAIIKEK